MRQFGGGVTPGVGAGFAGGVQDAVQNFYGALHLANQSKYADIAKRRQDMDDRLMSNEENFVVGQRNAQADPMGGVRMPSPMPNPGADALAPQGAPMGNPGGGAAQVLPNATPGMAQASPTGGGPLQQAEEYSIDPKVSEAYKKAGEASVHRDRFHAELKAELGNYRGIEQGLAKTIFEAQNLKSQHAQAVKDYGAGSPEVLQIEANIQKLQSDHSYYKKQLGDFRNTILGLASETNPETGEVTITDPDLHQALSQWMDKGTTVGQRAGIEKGLTTRPRMPGGMRPSMRRPSGPSGGARGYKQSGPAMNPGAAALARSL